jgi:hypothetical protein
MDKSPRTANQSHEVFHGFQFPTNSERPEYGRCDKGQSTLSVKNLDKLTGLLLKVNENQFLKY